MLVEGGYRAQEHNHLSPLMTAFAFAMLSVGFTASAATLSIFFLIWLRGVFLQGCACRQAARRCDNTAHECRV